MKCNDIKGMLWESSRGGGFPPWEGVVAPFRVGMAPHLSPLYVLLLMPQPAVVSHGKKVEYLFLNQIIVRGHWHCPPPLKNVAGPEKFPLVFLIKACAIKTVFQGGNWLNSWYTVKKKWPRLKYTVRAVHLPLLIRLISTVVCISAQGAPSAKIFFDLFIWCLKELWHRISDS